MNERDGEGCIVRKDVVVGEDAMEVDCYCIRRREGTVRKATYGDRL